VAEACAAAAQPAAKFVAGGTNLIDLMKLQIETPAHLVDIGMLPLADIEETGDGGLRIGARVTNSALAADMRVRRLYPLLSQAILAGASTQLRNKATTGGNLLQRTRCPYFRNGAGGIYPCNKREPGSGCAAIGGIDRGQAVLGTSSACTAVSPGDWPVALTALDATIELIGPSGARSVPIADFYLLPGSTPHREFAIQPGEIITGIAVPKTPAGARSTYHKIRDRESYAFALASAAVALTLDKGRITTAHVALGGVGTRPWRARETEALLQGQPPTREAALGAARAAFANARPGKLNAFKIELGARTIADAVVIAAERNA
jgi:xanthine dehydrogenase YagS FAD-binding subunit